MNKSSPSSSLLTLQNKFQDYVLKGHNAIEEVIVSSEQVSSCERLAIYQNAYQARLIEALAHNYPVLQTHLGIDAFNHLGMLYSEKYPSPYRSIRWFGENLPEFLSEDKTCEEAFSAPKPYLAELAQFELKLSIAFDSADEEHLTEAMLLSVPPEDWPNLRFIPHASFQRTRFCWNVVSLWQSITNEEILPTLVEDKTATDWIIWRKDYQCHFYSLKVDESWAWDAVLQKEDFAAVCSYLKKCFLNNRLSYQASTDIDTAVSLRAASLLKGWIESGLLSAYYHGLQKKR